MLFTERIIQGMGGTGDTYACAVEMTRAWERADHFELFEDALPVLDELRGHGLKLGLLSNTGRDLDAFVAHHGIDGRRDPDVAPARQDEAARDDLPRDARAARRRRRGARRWSATIRTDDVDGARAVGMRRVARRPRRPLSAASAER